jgi:hypothetical protein
MSFHDFDVNLFSKNIIVDVKIIAFAQNREDAKKERRDFFYKLINIYFLKNFEDENQSQILKKKKMNIIKSSRRSRIEMFTAVI